LMQEHRNGRAMWEIAHMLWLENRILLAVVAGRVKFS